MNVVKYHSVVTDFDFVLFVVTTTTVMGVYS